MKSLLFCFTCCLFLTISVHGQVGKAFPNMECRNLEDGKISIPSGLIGKKSVLCLAYSQKAQEKLEKWLSEAIPKFVLRGDETSLIPLEPYNVNTYFIAMYTGANKIAANNASTQIKNNVDKLLHSYVLIYAGDLEPYKTKLNMINKDDPYVFVLDHKGNVEYMYSGAYNAKAMDDIENLIADEE